MDVIKTLDATVVSLNEGMIYKKDIHAIRVNSKDYRLLIMSDHAPILGEIDGNIYFLYENDEEVFENVKGFFTHNKNHFKFIEKF